MAVEKLKNWEIVLIFVSPIVWFIYYVFLAVVIGSFDSVKNHGGYIAGAVLWGAIIIGTQVYIACKLIQKYDKEPFRLTYFNAPLFFYLILVIGPYMYALHYAFEHNVEFAKSCVNKSIPATCQTIVTKNVSKFDTGVLFGIMAAIVIGTVFYPLLKRKPQSISAAIACVGILNAFDIMDIVSDLKYLLKYNAVYQVWFFVAVIISIMLLAFPIGLDEEDEDDPQKGRICKTIVSLFFTDISLLCLRCIVMAKEDSLEFGLVFAFKNFISAFVNIILLSRAWCCPTENQANKSPSVEYEIRPWEKKISLPL